MYHPLPRADEGYLVGKMHIL